MTGAAPLPLGGGAAFCGRCRSEHARHGMTKSELIELITAKQKHLPAKDVELALKQMLEIMSDALAAGERIEIRGGDFAAAVGAGFAVAEIVGDDEEDIGPRGPVGRRERQREAKGKQNRETHGRRGEEDGTQ